MRCWYVLALVLVGLSGCGKNSSEPAPVYTSPDGIWVYTTPDKSIHVEFELNTSSGTLAILDPTIEVSGTAGTAAGQLTNVDLPLIEQIRINANDASLVVPYAITFMNCSMGSAFNVINVADATYTYPWGSLKTLTAITIKRK